AVRGGDKYKVATLYQQIAPYIKDAISIQSTLLKLVTDTKVNVLSR
ncbi:MAG: hypothetical protein ACI8SJ_000521, partial [Shewanella sp.]